MPELETAVAGTGSPPGVTRALYRGLRVLEVIATQGADSGLGLGEIAAAAGIDKATTARLAQTLCTLGYAYQDGNRYRLTGRLLWLGTAHRNNLDLPARAGPHLAELRRRTGETVHLGVRERHQVVYLSKLETRLPVQIASAIGQTMPLHTTALGKAMLAAMPAPQREALLDSLALAPRTDRSITDHDQLRRELARTAARGYAVDDRENEEAVICVSAAVVDAVGEALAAVSVAGPSFRMAQRVGELGELCRATAGDIGAAL